MSFYQWKPYLPVAKRRANAQREISKLVKKGQTVEPVTEVGTKIANTFWGKAWCEHLEKFSDYANRLPRGRTYVRNGSVCHLGISTGKIEALVSGSELYQIKIDIEPLSAAKWQSLREQCTGKIGSALELLQGKISNQIMAIVTDMDHGMFPNPGEIHMSCSCPDWAGMCKHLAAAMYGIGARLDLRPELLFQLRGVDPQDLITADLSLTDAAVGTGKFRHLDNDNLSELFGIAVDEPNTPLVSTKTDVVLKSLEKTVSSTTTTTSKLKTSKLQTPIRPAPWINLPGSVTRDCLLTKQQVAQQNVAKTPIVDSPKRSLNTAHTLHPINKQGDFVPTGSAISELRNRFGMSAREFALLVGVTTLTIKNWEGNEGPLNLTRRPLESLRSVANMTPQQAKNFVANLTRT